jgi:hypothetical protein
MVTAAITAERLAPWPGSAARAAGAIALAAGALAVGRALGAARPGRSRCGRGLAGLSRLRRSPPHCTQAATFRLPSSQVSQAMQASLRWAVTDGWKQSTSDTSPGPKA